METSCVFLGETVMKNGTGAGEQLDVSRQELYEGYVSCYLQLCTEVKPCRDAQLLEKAALYLLQEPEPAETFTVFPFYRSVLEGTEALSAAYRTHLSAEDLSTDYRKHLSAVIKATELLETLCINLFVQPWKKEIKTLKCFTGPFVYCLLPVFSSSTIQSVLASIGYLPHTEHTDTPHSEYKLSVDADPDTAMLVGFELLLARVKCLHLLELLDKDQLGPQEWLEVVQKRAGLMKTEEHTEKKTGGQMEDEEEEKKKKKKDEDEANKNEVPPCAVKPVPKPRRCHLSSVDRSMMEMHMTYDDLAIKGRPVLQHKPRRVNSSRSSSKSVHTASDDRKALQPPDRSWITSSKAAATNISSKTDAREMTSDNSRNSDCSDGTSCGNNMSSSFKNRDGNRAGDELSGSKDITLTAECDAEQSLKPEELQPTAETPACTQQPAADLQNKRPARPERPSLTSVDEEQDLRELAERMGQLHVQETREKVKKRGEENMNKERRQKGRKASTEGEAEEQNLRKPVTSPKQRSSQFDPTVMKEQKLPSALSDCQSAAGGGSAGHQEGGRETPDRGEEEEEEEEEQLPPGFVVVEHHKK